MRKAGVLLPVFSIPSNYGIGTFSREAYEFVDLLAASGQKLWQILPIGPVAFGDSPYQSPSTFAGNYMYIDLEDLISKGLLTKDECDAVDFGNDVHRVNYDAIRDNKLQLLKSAFERKNCQYDESILSFCNQNEWVESFAEYCALKERLDNRPWFEWTKEEIDREKQNIEEEKNFYIFIQYLFMEQWLNLKNYANSKGIQIVGDLPIYVAYDSADVFAEPKLFQLNEDNTPVAVAGCPPDAFSEDGQHWGNPLFNWDYHKETGYGWWIRRIDQCRKLFDIVRIDHFRGFDEYYAIPYGATTAREGHWEKGPGIEFFNILKGWFGELNIIAEDLGIITDSVRELVKATGFPGMRILQFAFDESRSSSYLPHFCDKNCIVYTGTHDNNTTLGWYNSLLEEMKDYVSSYVNAPSKSGEDVTKCLVRTALASTAETAIIQLQDYLCMGEESRTNVPGTVGGNWSFRVTKEELSDLNPEEICTITRLYGR